MSSPAACWTRELLKLGPFHAQVLSLPEISQVRCGAYGVAYTLWH